VRAAAWQLRSELVPARSTVALWHEVGRRTRDDTTATVYRTTPITVGRPERGAVEAAVSCRVCRRPVRVRVVDAATARRRRRWGTLLVRSQFVLALVLVCAEVTGLAAFDVRLGSGSRACSPDSRSSFRCCCRRWGWRSGRSGGPGA
jgi:hypothetical protein